MNVRNTLIAVALIGGSIVCVIFSEGLLLPFVLPLCLYAFKLMGVKVE